MTTDTIITIVKTNFYRLDVGSTKILSGQQIIDLAPLAGNNSMMGIGALILGVVIGWNLYFINRYRKKESIGLTDLGIVLTALAGAALINFLSNSPNLIGLYGIGLGVGFFMYLLFLIYLSRRSKNPDYMFPDYFLKLHDSQQPVK